jgi:hypothetical protein
MQVSWSDEAAAAENGPLNAGSHAEVNTRGLVQLAGLEPATYGSTIRRSTN